MKGGISKYLPKYYKLQEKSSELGGDNFILMDHISGLNLDDFLLKNRLTLCFWTKLFIIKNIINALQFVHSYGIIHFDLKPSNIMVGRDLQIKLLDFGESYHSSQCKSSKRYLI